jgi:ABC-type transporter Mla subunit MlaD
MEVLTQIAALPNLTLGFMIFIVAIAVAFHVRYNEKTIASGPTILTTTGIFATFIGIAIGLSKFETTNIQASVPELLSGLKTAFWASVCGVGAALTIKFRHYIFDVKSIPGTTSSGEPTVEDIVRGLQNIHQSLAGDDESTLISQIKLLRQDSNDRLDALKKAQIEALEKLSQLGSQALIEALRSVIQDFNAKITEQFGENFKHLNEAVGQLLVWQQQHKDHVETTAARHGEIVVAMKEATDNFGDLASHAGSFTQTAGSLSSLITTLETQRDQLQTSLKSLGDLLTAASGAIPQIETKIVDIARQLSNSVTESQKMTSNAIAENMTAIKRSIETSTQESAKAHQDHMKQTADMIARTKEQVTTLDAALSEELQKSLESLGRQLAALSEKFVSDYSPLTDRLKQVMEIASRIR